MQVLVTDPVMDAVQPRFQVCEDEMDDWQILLGDLRIAPFSDGDLRTLRRRSQKDRFTWERIKRLADDWLPQPRTLHPWPSARFAVKYSR